MPITIPKSDDPTLKKLRETQQHIILVDGLRRISSTPDPWGVSDALLLAHIHYLKQTATEVLIDAEIKP